MNVEWLTATAHKNLMMDASAMYPQGSHPINDVFLPDAKTIARPLPRTSAPVRYYFVDYGLSVYIHPDAPSKLVLGVLGRDQEVPELSDEAPYDPFAVDIFIVGNLFRHIFFEQYSNVDFLVPLFEAMIQHDAIARPNAKEARQRCGLPSAQPCSRSRLGGDCGLAESHGKRRFL